MSHYPHLALDVLRRLNESDSDYRHLLDAVQKNDTGKGSTGLKLKKALLRVDQVFRSTITTPGQMIHTDAAESDEDIERRFWRLFFESLVYATTTHRRTKHAKETDEAFKDYCAHLQIAIEQAEALVESLHTLEALQERHGFAHKTPWRDPISPLIETLELYSKASGNPVYEQLTAFT
ncbi:hypothetical protein [Methylotuvimicrobium alcaliphilum]|uniref:Uncharacterized protein n=1 Tax=Methylotuvimicrobium alcaliphilum (strain DSM 19304 / NCIMB 14124 / VKM B-2133 / 20Z) TaxID=1091494 RepID=G4ST71_META2|nr:hypothetical protein [Methylotuvimicrobium alcaliphilum]CCE23824.1 protein of unknown function [Methylotuvimicrobium alcaliphilum 20Z]